MKMISEELKNIKSDKTELEKFGKTIGVVLVIIGIILIFFNRSGYIYLLSGGLILIISAYVFPAVLKPLQKVWMGLSVLLGWLSTRIILSILFYLIFTSIKMIAKLFGKNFLELKTNKNIDSYWHYRERKTFNPEEYERQF